MDTRNIIIMFKKRRRMLEGIPFVYVSARAGWLSKHTTTDQNSWKRENKRQSTGINPKRIRFRALWDVDSAWNNKNCRHLIKAERDGDIHTNEGAWSDSHINADINKMCQHACIHSVFLFTFILSSWRTNVPSTMFYAYNMIIYTTTSAAYTMRNDNVI